MSVTIGEVERGSIGERLGLGPGDILTRIDSHDIVDVLDYRFYMTSSRLVLEGQRASGEAFSFQVRKGQYDDLGLGFDTYLMDKQRFCKNKCVFCFIDQLPGGLRESLYFKDDDSRMSFLFGNYVTLTNLEERDVQRIIDMHISPINISIHTTNPQLRVEMMKNPAAGRVLDFIPRLAQAGIKINGQLVLCPGLNDGPELERSLRDLCALAPGIQSVAVVPVGLTSHRQGLSPLRLFIREEARAVLATVGRFGDDMVARHGQRTCFSADEFYLAAGVPIPGAEFYEEFAQLENGVGLLASLEEEFTSALGLEPARPVERRVTIATGTAPGPFIRALARKAMARFPGLNVEVVPIVNEFFGPTITVAGLVTGGDLLRQLKDRDLGDALLIPSVMLRHEGDLFLDSLHKDTLAAELHCPVLLIPNDGFALLDALLGIQEK